MVQNIEYSFFESSSSLPQKTELVIVTVPAEASLAVVKEAAEQNCRTLLLIPAFCADFFNTLVILELEYFSQ